MSSDSDKTPKSPTISTEFLSTSSPTEETTTSNLIVEVLPDNFISDKKEQNVTDYEILSKSSDGNVSDTSEEESQKDRKKRNADEEVPSPPPDNNEGGLIIEEVHDVESIGEEKIERAAIIEEVECYQGVKKENGDGPFKKNKKRKISNDPSIV